MIYKPALSTIAQIFGRPYAYHVRERALRHAEEAIEFAQACGVEWSMIERCGKHAYSKPPGAIKQEIGGALLTLQVACTVIGEDCDDLAIVERYRLMSMDWARLREKHQAKIEAGRAYKLD